jgi:hypothetical protein
MHGKYFPITTFRLPDCPYSYQKGRLTSALTVCPYIAIYKTDLFFYNQVSRRAGTVLEGRDRRNLRAGDRGRGGHVESGVVRVGNLERDELVRVARLVRVVRRLL